MNFLLGLLHAKNLKHCKVREKSNDLGKMGKSALWKHVKTDTHKRNMKDKTGVRNVFKQPVAHTSVEPASTSTAVSPSPSASAFPSTSASQVVVQENLITSFAHQLNTAAGMYWTLFSVKHTFRDNAMKNFVPTLQRIFPNCNEIGRSKTRAK